MESVLTVKFKTNDEKFHKRVSCVYVFTHERSWYLSRLNIRFVFVSVCDMYTHALLMCVCVGHVYVYVYVCLLLHASLVYVCRMIFLCAFLFSGVYGLRFPTFTVDGWESVPVLHESHPVRTSSDKILLLWSAGAHSIGETVGYEVVVCWPMSINVYDWDFYPRPSLNNPAADWAESWSDWTMVYTGMGRQFEFDIASQVPGGLLVDQRVFFFKVRAVCDLSVSCLSEWSNEIYTNVLLEGPKERFTLELIGTGRNNAGLTRVTLDGEPIVSRANLVGLTVCVFSRTDFALVSTTTYDTHNDKEASTLLANDIRAIGPEYYISVVSSGEWELNFTPTAASALEQIGGYYVGQWARVFSITSIQFNPYADIAEWSSSDSFGHPYALFGHFGLGMGNGYESLQLPTGHYLALGKADYAIIRVGLYYNYPLGRYVVAADLTSGESSPYFTRSQYPATGTLHAPVPDSRTIFPLYQIHPTSEYAPYVGNLWNQVEYIMESNETVYLPQYNLTNFGFQIVISLWLPSPFVGSDPRRDTELESELERVWGGPSWRVSGIDSSVSLPGTVMVNTERPCPESLIMRADVGSCSNYDDSTLTATSPLMQYGVGQWPMICSTDRTGCEDPPIETTYVAKINPPTNIQATVAIVEDSWY